MLLGRPLLRKFNSTSYKENPIMYFFMTMDIVVVQNNYIYIHLILLNSNFVCRPAYKVSIKYSLRQQPPNIFSPFLNKLS